MSPTAAALWAPTGVVVPPEEAAHCWSVWLPGHVASATQCPEEEVLTHWPAIYEQLDVRGIAQPPVLAAALATIAIETAHTFLPVREAFWLTEDWREQNLRYHPYYGRGYVQLTWDYNYRSYGEALGLNLVGDPELAMAPHIAAAVLAEYFLRARVAEAAQAHDWREVRRRVQGGYAAIDELLAIVSALGMT